MKTKSLAAILIITAVLPVFAADIFPPLDERPIAELALKAILAHRTDIKSSDLKLASIDCRYFYNNDFIPYDGAAHKRANAIATFIIIQTRRESIQDKTKIAEYEALQVIVVPELAPTEMKIEDTRITFTRGM